MARLLTEEGADRARRHWNTLEAQKIRLFKRVSEAPEQNAEGFANLSIEIARISAIQNCLNELLNGVL